MARRISMTGHRAPSDVIASFIIKRDHMVRTQIQLTEQQQVALRRLSAATGRSVAVLIRQGVEYLLSSAPLPDQEEQIQRARRVAGRFRSGGADGSSDHDRHFQEQGFEVLS
jgi:hypothetical protein